jgi:formate/nitrite transporter FocA (FNT family)
MLMAWWLLFPRVVDRAETRLNQTPGQTFALGLAGALVIGLPLLILFALPFGPTKLIASVLLMAALILASFGAAGLAASMGERLAERAGWARSDVKAFLGGALALELAAAFPLLGWLIVIPFTIVTCLGASLFALLRWMPGSQAESESSMVVEGSLAGEPQSA